MTKLRLFLRAVSTALSIFKYSNFNSVKWEDDDRLALIQYLRSESGERLRRLLLAFCSLRDARVSLAAGGKFEAGKAVGCREMVSYLDYICSSGNEKDSETADNGDTADLGHLVP